MEKQMNDLTIFEDYRNRQSFSTTIMKKIFYGKGMASLLLGSSI